MKIFSLFRKRNKRRSTVDCLREILTSNQWQKIQAATPDRRDFIQGAAMMLRVSEDELLSRIGARLKVPVMTRIPPIDLQVLQGKVSIDELRQIGVAPIASSGVLGGLACIDPQAAGSVIERLSNPPIYIALWPSVRQALDEAERIEAARVRRGVEEDALKRKRSARSVLELLSEEVLKHGAHSTEIVPDEGKLFYRFSLPDGKVGTGQINAKIAPSLLELLSDIEAGKESVTHEIEGTQQKFESVRHVGRKGFTLSMSALVSAEAKVIPHPALRLATREDELQQEAPPVRHDVCESGDLEAPSSYTVLLVEDNQSFAKVLTKVFRTANIEVVHCTSGLRALEYLRTQDKPSLIVCDVHMPEMNGLQFLKALRQDAQYSDLPVIMLTSDEEDDTQVSVLKEGADSFVGKSDNPKVLLAHVKRHLEKRFRIRAA